VAPTLPPGPGPQFDRTVFFSHRLGAHRLSRTGTIPLGVAHYSHDLVGRRIRQAINHLGIHTRELIRPEIYSSPDSYALLPDFLPGDMHIIFKPIEEIRILRGAFNVGCIIWEFDRLNEQAFSSNPLSNHLRVLKILDEVWCYCAFTRDVLRRYIPNVHLIPPPFPIYTTGRLTAPQAARMPDELSKVPAMRLETLQKDTLGNLLGKVPAPHWVLLSIFNPHDLRKNIGNLIESFLLFQRDKPGAILLLKCIVDNSTVNLGNVHALIGRHAPLKAAVGNIFVITQELSPDHLRGLYRLGDFYFCTSHCEGLGMPVIEAMAEGLIPISVNNTAMADYITDRNSFVIPSKPERAYPSSNNSSNPNLTWFTAGTGAIVSALERAYHCSSSSLDRMRIAAANTISKQYSLEAAADSIAARLRDIPQLIARARA
jgi:glycosyltransferase involved in cell wall biosynthesis